MSVEDLAKQLGNLVAPTSEEQNQPDATNVRYSKATVTAVSTTDSTCTLQFAASTAVAPTPIAGINYTVRPKVGDVVLVAVQGPTRLVVGVYGGSGLCKIFEKKLTVAAANIDTLTTIPPVFDSLQVECIGKGVGAFNDTLALLSINSDVTNSYDLQELYAQGATVGRSNASWHSIILGLVPGSNGNTHQLASAQVAFPDYAGGSFRKAFHVSYLGYWHGATPPVYGGNNWGTWRNGAPIERLTMFLSSGSLEIGSSMRVYGRTEN